MEKNKLFILSAQCAMFFNPAISVDKSEKADLLTKITNKCGELLDGEPTILPIPLDAPPDIPRLQLNGKNNLYSYGISLKRSDLVFNETGDPNKSVDDVYPELFKYEKKLLELYKDEKAWNISRLAIIVNYIAELEDRVSDFISKNFILNSPSYNSIELSLLKKDSLNSMGINRWIRIKQAGKQDKTLHLLVDINTVAERKLNLSVDEMAKFYDCSIPYLKNESKETFGELIK